MDLEPLPNGIKSIMKLSKKQIYILLISVVLAFILINSMLNGIISQWLSSLPKNFVQSFIPYGKYKWLDVFLIHYIRKFAHLVEYAVFAIFVVKLYYLKKESFQRLLNTAFICFSVAFLDETIQMFSNRQAKISDVWLDLLGCAIGVSVYCLYRFCRNKRRRIK